MLLTAFFYKQLKVSTRIVMILWFKLANRTLKTPQCPSFKNIAHYKNIVVKTCHCCFLFFRVCVDSVVLSDCKITARLYWLCTARYMCKWIYCKALSLSLEEVMWLTALSNHFDHPLMCSMWLDCAHQAFTASGSDLKIWTLTSHCFPLPQGLEKLAVSTHNTMFLWEPSEKCLKVKLQCPFQ